jgi:ribonuclease P protein component
VSLKYPGSVRLRSRREFVPVQEQGRRISTKYMTVLGRIGSGTSDRLGIIASRKFGGAVQRNRAKRRLREAFRRQDPLTIGARGLRALDVVVIPRRELIAAPFAVVEAELQTAVRKLRGMK